MGLLGKIWVKLGLDNSELNKGFKDSEKSATGFQNSLKKIGGMMAAAFSVTAVLGFVKKSVEGYNASALALTNLETVLKSTGGAAGWTSEQMQSFAKDLQAVTKFEDGATIAAMAVLASFKGINGDVFKGVVTAAMDMSTVIGGDLQSNVYQLAKALERPAEGIQLLNRSTRAFSLAQIEDIKKLVAEGKTHEAQLTILAALEGKFGGAAKAAGDTASGGWDKMKNALGDLMETIGSGAENTIGLVDLLTKSLKLLNKVLLNDFKEGTLGYFLFVNWGKAGVKKATDEANVAAQETIKSINSVAAANAMLNDIRVSGTKGMTSYSIALSGLLTAYVNENKQKEKDIDLEKQKQEGQIALDKVVATKVANASAATEAAALKEQMGLEGTIKRTQWLVAEIEKKILVTNTADTATLTALIEEKNGLNILIDRWQTTTAAGYEYLQMIEAIRAENDTNPIMPVAGRAGVDAKGAATIKPLIQTGIQPITAGADPTGLKSYNDTFDEEVNRSADIANRFGQTVAVSISDSMQVIFDAIASGEDIDTSDMTKALLLPFAQMATQIGEVMVATGVAALAAKAIGSAGGPWGAIAAGAALIALGTAATAAINASGKNFGKTGNSGGEYSYNGGGAVTQAIPTVNPQPIAVTVSGVLRGQDIYLSSEKYQQNKAR